jgi:hypothetical protein
MTQKLKDYGWCQVLKKEDRYFISYDAGGIAIHMKQIVITDKQALSAMVDQYEAEKIIKEIVES